MAHIPYKKLSKREQRQIDQTKRGTWGSVSPITRKIESAKAYDRKKVQRKTQRWHMEPPLGFLMLPI